MPHLNQLAFRFEPGNTQSSKGKNAELTGLAVTTRVFIYSKFDQVVRLSALMRLLLALLLLGDDCVYAGVPVVFFRLHRG